MHIGSTAKKKLERIQAQPAVLNRWQAVVGCRAVHYSVIIAQDLCSVTCSVTGRSVDVCSECEFAIH